MATHILSLQIGSTNIPLSTTDAMLLDYTPVTPNETISGAGVEIYTKQKERVTESIRLWLYAASGALVQAKIATIERFISEVSRRQISRNGDRGYLYVQLLSDTEVWRSEILDARLHLGENSWRHWATNGVEVMLSISRRPYFETVVERNVYLDNTSTGSKTTSGVTIYNHDDSGTNHDNWVDIAAADIEGNLPAPLRIRLKNTSGSDLFTKNFWQANNAFHDPTTFDHIIEGEDALSVTTVADTGSSGGNYGRASWTPSIEHSLNLFSWTLPTSFMADTAGGFFRVLIRFANTPPSGIEMQLHIKGAVSPYNTLWDGPKFVSTDTLLQDAGVIQIPPGMPASNFRDLLLVLSASYGSANSLSIDFVQFTPADSTRHIIQASYAIASNEFIENNGPEERVYNIATTGEQEYLFKVYNSVIWAWPNRDQRLIFLQDDTTMNIARTWLVTAYYRPRRNTL